MSICDSNKSPMVDAFASSLCLQMSAAFPSAEVEFDGENVTLYHSGGDERFVHVVVDFTCLSGDDVGFVAVHARPDHVLEKHWVEVEHEDLRITRALTVADGVCFEDGDGSDGDEYADGFGNTVWTFSFPSDKDRIAALAVGVSALCAGVFAV